jgi:integrase-like protein
MGEVLLDAAGRRRSPATMPGFHAGRPPRNKGRRYPADPPTVEEIVAVMRAAGDRRHGCRLRGLIVVLWRAGLRIHEALALNESDLDHRRGALLVRRGKGGRRREVGMDEWAWEHLRPGSICASNFRSVRCFASSTDRPEGDHGHRPPRAPSCAARPRPQAFADASRRTSCATRTPSRWRTRACR